MNKIIISFLILILSLNLIHAQDLPNYKDKYVNDFSNIFTQDEINQLRSTLAYVEQNSTAEVVVVTVETTEPYTPSDYRTKLFNYWKVGKADVDNGLLILYSKKEHRIEVEVGYGLEGLLPDAKVGRMLDDYYVPLRDSGNTTAGIIQFTNEIAKLLETNSNEIKSGSATKKFPTGITIFLILFFFIFILIIVLKFRAITTNPYNNSYSRRSYSIFTGGFGGGGFGGGGSGGGGAGR